MTIKIELLNTDQHRSVKVVHEDAKYGEDGKPTGEFISSESEAGVIEPQQKGDFWIHSGRRLRVEELD